MKPGQLLTLTPFRRSKARHYKRQVERDDFNDVLREHVTFIKMSRTDNAVIIDQQGNTRYCNPDDLTPVLN